MPNPAAAPPLLPPFSPTPHAIAIRPSPQRACQREGGREGRFAGREGEGGKSKSGSPPPPPPCFTVRRRTRGWRKREEEKEKPLFKGAPPPPLLPPLLLSTPFRSVARERTAAKETAEEYYRGREENDYLPTLSFLMRHAYSILLSVGRAGGKGVGARKRAWRPRGRGGEGRGRPIAAERGGVNGGRVAEGGGERRVSRHMQGGERGRERTNNCLGKE